MTKHLPKLTAAQSSFSSYVDLSEELLRQASGELPTIAFETAHSLRAKFWSLILAIAGSLNIKILQTNTVPEPLVAKIEKVLLKNPGQHIWTIAEQARCGGAKDAVAVAARSALNKGVGILWSIRGLGSHGDVVLSGMRVTTANLTLPIVERMLLGRELNDRDILTERTHMRPFLLHAAQTFDLVHESGSILVSQWREMEALEWLDQAVEKEGSVPDLTAGPHRDTLTIRMLQNRAPLVESFKKALAAGTIPKRRAANQAKLLRWLLQFVQDEFGLEIDATSIVSNHPAKVRLDGPHPERQKPLLPLFEHFFGVDSIADESRHTVRWRLRQIEKRSRLLWARSAAATSDPEREQRVLELDPSAEDSAARAIPQWKYVPQNIKMAFLSWARKTLGGCLKPTLQGSQPVARTKPSAPKPSEKIAVLMPHRTVDTLKVIRELPKLVSLPDTMWSDRGRSERRLVSTDRSAVTHQLYRNAAIEHLLRHCGLPLEKILQMSWLDVIERDDEKLRMTGTRIYTNSDDNERLQEVDVGPEGRRLINRQLEWCVQFDALREQLEQAEAPPLFIAPDGGMTFVDDSESPCFDQETISARNQLLRGLVLLAEIGFHELLRLACADFNLETGVVRVRGRSPYTVDIGLTLRDLD